MENIDLSVFKKQSLLMAIASLGIACLVFFVTYMDVSQNFEQLQGTARALIIGFSLTSIFIIYSILCFKSFKTPTVKNTSIIYGVQSILFSIVVVLAWVELIRSGY